MANTQIQSEQIADNVAFSWNEETQAWDEVK
jgi:hypothetical protein